MSLPFLHTSEARKHCSDTALLELLRTDPPSCTAVRSVAGADFSSSIFACGEPAVMRAATASWPAAERWSNAQALSEHYGNVDFRPAGLAMTLDEYLQYASTSTADFPAYIVETSFEGSRAVLLEDYVPPPLFADNLAELPGTRSRPHWFLGGTRTGSSMHIDPRCACGWNACLFGCKRWLMLAPETDLAAHGLEGSPGGPYTFFAAHLSRLQAAAASGEIHMREHLQQPGELMYIPAGWHHCVVNLELSCAIAHTLIAPAALPFAWPRLRALHAPFALALRDMLEAARPALAAMLTDSCEDAPSTVVIDRSTAGTSPSTAGISRPVGDKLQWARLSPREVVPHLADGSGSAKSVERAVFVHTSWLAEVHAIRPCVRDVLVEGGAWGGHDALCTYHERLDLVGRAAQMDGVGAPTAATAVCVVLGEDHDKVLVEEMRRDLLRHGVRIAALVTPGEELGWACAHNAASMATLCASAPAEYDPRLRPIAHQIAHGAALCQLRTERREGCGMIACAAASLRRGDTILELPLAACLRSSDVGAYAKHVVGPIDTYGHLLLVLLDTVMARPLQPIGEYFDTLFTAERDCAIHMQTWDDSCAAARRVAHTVAWRRSRQSRAEAAREWAALRASGKARFAALEWETYLWAKLCLGTRAFKTGSGFALCPLLDLPNHASLGATARFEQRDDTWVLSALYTLDEGDEITVCYDANADYLDIFERYGFFDSTATIHTAEIIVPPATLGMPAASMPGGLVSIREDTEDDADDAADDAADGGDGGGKEVEAWRLGLMDALASEGSDPALNAWWVPDVALDASPLYLALRLGMLTPEEVARVRGSEDAVAELRARPVACEAEVRAKMAGLLRSWLGGYATTVLQDADSLQNGGQGAADEAAARLVLFEKTLLETHLRSLEMEGAQPVQTPPAPVE